MAVCTFRAVFFHIFYFYFSFFNTKTPNRSLQFDVTISQTHFFPLPSRSQYSFTPLSIYPYLLIHLPYSLPLYQRLSLSPPPPSFPFPCFRGFLCIPFSSFLQILHLLSATQGRGTPNGKEQFIYTFFSLQQGPLFTEDLL